MMIEILKKLAETEVSLLAVLLVAFVLLILFACAWHKGGQIHWEEIEEDNERESNDE